MYRLAHYDTNNGFSFGGKKKTELNQDTIDFLNDEKLNKKHANLDKISKKYADVDQNAVKFVQTMRTEGKQLQQGQTYLQAYEAQLNKTGFSLKNLPKSALSGFKALGAGVINALGGMAIGAVVSGGVSLISKAIDNAIETEAEKAEKLQEMAQKASEAKSNIESLSSSMRDNAKTVNDIKDRYAELSQGVDNLSNKNLSLSTGEYEEFLDLTNQLSEVFPQLNRGIDDNGNAILNLNGDVNTITSSLESMLQVEKELANQKIAENAGEYIKNTLPQLENSYENLENLKENYENEKKLRERYLNIDSIGKQSTPGEKIDTDLLFYGDDALQSGSWVLNDLEEYFKLEKKWEEIYSNDKYHNLIGYKIELTKEDKYNIEKYYSDFITTTETEIKKAESELARANQQLSSMASYWYTSELSLKDQNGKAIYDNLQSADLQNAIQQMFNDINWAKLSEDKDWDSEDDVYNYISDNILIPLENVSPEIKDSVYNNIIKAFTDTTLSSNDKLEILKNLQQQLSDLGITVDLSFKINEIENQNDIIRNQLGFNKNANNQYDAIKNQEIEAFINNLEDEEKTLWLNTEIPDDVKKGTKEDWERYIESLQKKADDNPLVLHSELQNNASSMKSAFDDLYKAYDDYQQNGLSGIDTTNLSNLNKEDTFGNINGTTASYEKFLAVMQNVNSTAEEVQNAFDELASDYIYHSELADQITEDNVEWIASELEKNSVINASAVAEQMLINKFGVESATVSECIRANLSLNGVRLNSENATEALANASVSEIDALIGEANASGVATTALSEYLIEKISATNTTINTDGDIANLLAMGEALGDVGKLLEQLIALKVAFNQQSSYMAKNEIQKSISSLESQIKAKIKSGTKANTSSGGSYRSSSGSSGGSGTDSETEQNYDWVEIKIQRLEEAISRLDKVVSNTYTNWSNRNAALSSEISKVIDEISVQKQVYDRYMQEANKVGLSAEYVSKIQNGKMDIETITDENLIDKIEAYSEWYNKALECSDAIQELNINLGELAEKKFDNIQSEFESYISVINSYANIIDERISRTEEQGYFVSRKYYQALIEYENQELTKLRTEQSSLSNSLAASVASGLIEKDSEAWNNMQSKILDIQKSIEESTTTLIEYNNAIRDLDWEIFDYILDRIDKINNEADFFISVLENMKLYDDTGNFSDFGLTTASLNLVKMTTYIKMAREYADELAKIDKDLVNDPNSKTLLERKEELIELQQEAILNSENEKQAIKSLVQEGINIHLQALTDLIDKYKETLQSAKDLYNYQSNITEQTSEIAKLQKILLAYQNDDSESARKSKQEYENQLKDAEKQLKETEWDKYISETEKLLDTLYTNYEETLNTRLDNIDALIETVSNSVNEGFDTVKDTLFSTSEKLGYDLTDSMNKIYGVESDGFLKITDQMVNSSNGISQNIINSSNSIINAINSIKDTINKMKDVAEQKANLTVKPTQSVSVSSPTPTPAPSPTPPPTQSSSSSSSSGGSGGNGNAEIGDKVTLLARNRFYQDSYGNGKSGYKDNDTQVYITSINLRGSKPYHISKGNRLGMQDLGWIDLKGLRGYRTGSRSIPYNQLAWTQEDGSELMYSSKDGAMLTPLGRGDKVFTKEMSDTLYDFARANVGINFNTTRNIPQFKPKEVVSVSNDNNISINLPGVTNYQEFKQQLQNDDRFASFIQQITIGEALGKNTLKRKKY